MTVNSLVIHFLKRMVDRKGVISIGDVKSKMISYSEISADEIFDSLQSRNYAIIENNKLLLTEHGKDFIETLIQNEFTHLQLLVHDNYDLALIEFLYYRHDYVQLSDFPEILKVTAPQHGNSINDGNLIQSLFRLRAYIDEQYQWYILTDIGKGYYESRITKQKQVKPAYHTIYNDYSTKVEGSGNQIITGGSTVIKSFNSQAESPETNELSKKMLKDLPKAKWYRHWGFIVAIIALLVATALALFG